MSYPNRWFKVGGFRQILNFGFTILGLTFGVTVQTQEGARHSRSAWHHNGFRVTTQYRKLYVIITPCFFTVDYSRWSAFWYCSRVKRWLDARARRIEKAAQRREYEAKMAGGCYVSIYRVDRAYGGPEEGGWYYDHWSLKDSWFYETLELAETREEILQGKTEQLTDAAKKRHDEVCAEQCEWLAERGLYDEPDYGGYGPDTPDLCDSHRVVIEKTKGQRCTTERPYYE